MTKRCVNDRSVGLLAQLSERIIGQPDSLEAIVPYVQMYQAGLAPEGRPAGVFLLLGPTGTGKTRTVEALAEVIHGSARNVLRIDCGEFQMEHEVAKLIGAPPGYLGHRETQPMLNQMKINQVMSERANLAIVLFDEIEKAAPSLTRILLGVLDRGSLRLGDNTQVSLERCFIFMTSNLGAKEMNREICTGFGFDSGNSARTNDGIDLNKKLDRIAKAAVKQRFSPEFMNRIDLSLTYHSLNSRAIWKILDLIMLETVFHIRRRTGDEDFHVHVTQPVRQFLLDSSSSMEYGAREIRRAVHKEILHPIAAMLVSGNLLSGQSVVCSLQGGQIRMKAQWRTVNMQRLMEIAHKETA